MKVQCDVCETAQATVMCCADEASLCAECDTRVHAANKLASKHQRVPLLYPSPGDLPYCDICQEKTGYFFCLEDRALLCRNCDYSIHSTNALAANHKRFLVSGIRVALQANSANEMAESTHTCSSLQESSPTTLVSQLSSPTIQSSQFNSAKGARQQKSVRLTSMPSSSMKSTVTVPRENPSLFVNVFKEESLKKAPPVSLPKQEQQQSQPVTSTIPQQSRHVTPAQVLPSKVIGAPTTTLPPSSANRQCHFSAGRQHSDWGMHMKSNMNSDDVDKGEVLASQRGGGGGMRRSSISEYLTEAIPGWRVDELLNLPDMDTIYNFADASASKVDASLFRDDDDWPAECNVQELGEAVVAEVPSIPSPPTASGVPRFTKPWGFGKSLKEPDLDFFLQCDDTLVVPDIGGVSSPATLYPSSLPQKRRRIF